MSSYVSDPLLIPQVDSLMVRMYLDNSLLGGGFLVKENTFSLIAGCFSVDATILAFDHTRYIKEVGVT